MRFVLILLLLAPAMIGQTRTATIAGTLLDAKTQKPIPAALVMAVHGGPPPSSKSTKSGGDGAFQIQGLAEGKYSLCVQAPGDSYLDPCQWNGNPTTVALVAGQSATGVVLRVAGASILTIQVQDAQKSLSQKTKDGRRPELTLGVWGPKGLYYPTHVSRSPGAAASLQGVGNSYRYQVAVPRDTALTLYIASRDLKLGDAAGAALPANANHQAFQHASGDTNPKSFAFSVLSLLP